MTTIEWTRSDDGTAGKTWNPVRGCSLVSEGCRNCYAMKQGHRFSGEGKPYHGLTKLGPNGPTWTGKVVCDESKLLEPLSWRKPARVFVNSMSDLFHEDVPDAFIDQVFAVMALAPQHTFQILTKRVERMQKYMTAWPDGAGRQHHVFSAAHLLARRLALGPKFDLERGFSSLDPEFALARNRLAKWPLLNVWLGVSVENQPYADERIPQLLETPAAVRFISYEPALGPVDLMSVQRTCDDGKRATFSALHRGVAGYEGGDTPRPERPKLDWVIVGGESGSGARPMDLAWVRSIVQQCQAAGVACFVKQLGANPQWSLYVDGAIDGILNDRKGGDMGEWPEWARVREFPETRSSGGDSE